MSKYKVGDIVRYSGGSSALCQLYSEHAGGFHAIHCLGGFIFVSESYPSNIYEATEEDKATFRKLRAETLRKQNR